MATEAHGWRFIVVDGSTVQSPGATGTEYRLHIGLDLATLALSHLLISDVTTGESLRHFALGPGEIGLADRGYGHPQAVAETVHAGAHLVLRLNPHNMPLYEADGTAVDLVAVLKGQAPRRVLCTVPVWVGPAAQRVAGWVHAYRLPPEQANLARAACRKRHGKKGKTPQATTLYVAGWVLVWTSVSPDVLSAKTIMTLYRARWQVELAIKRWKSLLDADALRARYHSPLAELWLHSKLRYALLVERRMRRTMGDSWGIGSGADSDLVAALEADAGGVGATDHGSLELGRVAVGAEPGGDDGASQATPVATTARGRVPAALPH